MANDIVATAMSFIFETEKKVVRDNIIAMLQLHRQPEAGQPVIDIMNVGVRFGETVWTHPDRGRQSRASTPLTVVNCFPEHDTQAKNLLSDIQLLERDTKRAQKTLTQLVRGMNSDQDLRDSLSDVVAIKLGLGHLERTRQPGFRYEAMEPRVHANILKDLDMIEGYFNAKVLLI